VKKEKLTAEGVAETVAGLGVGAIGLGAPAYMLGAGVAASTAFVPIGGAIALLGLSAMGAIKLSKKVKESLKPVAEKELQKLKKVI
jgi:hypothetical protein